MSAKERLQALQAALKERGVKDVKFFVDPNSNPSLTKLTNDVADMLDAVINGFVKPMPAAGDMPELRAGVTL